MNAFLLLFALSGTPEIEPVSPVDARNEHMISEISATSKGNRFVIRAVMCFDVLGFIVFFIAVRRSANRSRINEENTILLSTKIDKLLTLVLAEATVQSHEVVKTKNIAQQNSVKLDVMCEQINTNTAAIISEAKTSASDSAFAMPTPAVIHVAAESVTVTQNPPEVSP